MVNKKQFYSNEKHGESSSKNPEYSFFNYLCSGCFINVFCCTDGYFYSIPHSLQPSSELACTQPFATLRGQFLSFSFQVFLNIMLTAHAR